METQVSNNVGTKVIIPGIKKSVKNFKETNDYNYKVTIRGNKGSVEQVNFTRNTLTFIRNIISAIATNGYANTIFGKSFNKDYKFVAINLRNPGFDKISLNDVDVYLMDENTKERFHFNMSSVFKVKGVSFSSTGIRTNYYHNHIPTKEEIENRQITKKNYYNKNREAILEKSRQRYIAKRGENYRPHNSKKNNQKTIKNERPTLTKEQMIEKRREYARKHYLKNRERILEQKKEYNAKNRERRTAYNREWRNKNREHVNAYNRAMYHKNPSKRHEYYARYYAKKKAQDIS